MKKKRVLSLLMAATMVFALTACGGNEKEASDDSGQSADGAKTGLMSIL